MAGVRQLPGLAVSPLENTQTAWEREYTEEKLRYDAALESAKANSKKTAKGVGIFNPDSAAPPDAPEQPTMRRCVMGDTTIEALAPILKENPRGLLVARDELNTWLGSFSRYKGKAGGTDVGHWLSLWSALAILVDRRTNRSFIRTPPAGVSVIGGIQPNVLARSLTDEFFESGLSARLLLVMPDPPPKRWAETEIDPDTESAYRRLILGLLELQADHSDAEFDKGADPKPVKIKLSNEAKKLWIEYYNEIAAEQHSAADDQTAAALGKLEAYAARLALVHHVISCVGRSVDDQSPIDADSMAAGIDLARWFGREARRVYAMLAEPSEQRDLHKLAEWVSRRGGVVTAYDLRRASSSKYDSTEAAAIALDQLAQAGAGQWAERVTGKGRPTREFRLRRAAETAETSPASFESAAETTAITPADSEKHACTEGFRSYRSAVFEKAGNSDSPNDAGVSAAPAGVSAAPTDEAIEGEL